jgi:hypothetical protein
MDRIRLILTAQNIHHIDTNSTIRSNYSRLILVGIEFKSVTAQLNVLEFVKHLHLVDCKFQLNTEQLDLLKQYL